MGIFFATAHRTIFFLLEVDYGSDDNSWEPLQNFKELDVWKNYQEKLSNKRKREKTNSKRKSKKRKKEKKKVKKLKDGDVKNISRHRRKGGKDEYLIKMVTIVDGF